MGQRPITYIRQVLALVSYPDLIQKSDFPEDVKKKAQAILAGCKGGSAGNIIIFLLINQLDVNCNLSVLKCRIIQ